MKIVVLHNATSEESAVHDLDVIAQRDAVINALTARGHEAAALSCTLDLAECKRALDRLAPDVVFNLVESLAGTDRLMAAGPLLLEAMHLPFTGASAAAMLISAGKLSAKEALAAAGLPTPRWFTLERNAWIGGESNAAPPPRAIIKAIWEHASFEMGDDAVVGETSPAAVAAVLQKRNHATCRPHFAEEYIDGREFNLAILDGPGAAQVLPPAEIDFSRFPAGKPRIVGYDAKWTQESFEYDHTPRRFDFAGKDGPLVERLKELALACWRLFKLRGYARVDFRVDEFAAPWILEVNVNPCLSHDAGFAAAVARSGLSYDEAIARIVDAAITRYDAGPQQ